MPTDQPKANSEDDGGLTQVRDALERAETDLASARSGLMEAERRSGNQRRQRNRLTADRRRVSGEIAELASLPPMTELRVSQLAKYWQPCHHNSVLYWIRQGHLPAGRDRGGYFVLAKDALVFQPRLYSHTQSRLTKPTTGG